MLRASFATLLCCGLSGCQSHLLQDRPIAQSVAAEASSAAYRIRLDPAQPLRLYGELDLRSFPGKGRSAQARGVAIGVASQIRAPQCAGKQLSGETQDGPWAIPDDCEILTWDIEVASVPSSGLDASRQQSVYFERGNWWLFSEPSSLLRVTGGADVARAMRLEAGGAQLEVRGRRAAGSADELHVPPTTSAPEFHVLGSPAAQSLRFGPIAVDYVLDDPARISGLPLADAHVAMLDFLLVLLEAPQSLPDTDSRLLVVWLGIDAAVGEAGGAAGGRSFLANYIDGGEDADAQALNNARTLMILGHEQFHQLHDLLGEGTGTPLPTWFGESLAQYYALRALQHSGLPEAVVQRAVGHFIDPERPVQHGLVALQAQHEQGDPEAYGMFYFQGASFWSEVDRVLRETANPHSGLDAIAPRLVRTSGEGAGMPADLRQHLLDLGGAPMQAVLDRYL